MNKMQENIMEIELGGGDAPQRSIWQQAKPEDWGMLFAAFGSAYGIGLLSMLLLPFLIGTTITGLGIDEAQAGLLGTVEFVGVMAASLVAAPFIGKLPRRNMALVGAAIAILGNVISSFQTSYEMLIFIRPIVGIGAGLALAAGNATVANARDPERLAGHMNILFVVLMLVTMNIFSRLSELGYQESYMGLAVTMFVMALFIFKLPQRAAQNLQATFEHPHASRSLLSMAGFFMLVAMFFFALRDTMAWAFVERIGGNVGYSVEEIGGLLSLQAVLGLLGPIVASIVGARLGYKIPLITGVLATGTVTYSILMSGNSMVMYTSAVMGIAITYFFTLSYLTALAAELDKEGRIVAASGSFLIAGVAVGPALSGYIIVHGGYALTGWFMIGIPILTLMAVLVPIYSLRSKTE